MFIYDPFTKVQKSEIFELVAGTTFVSNYNDVGLTCFISDTSEKCLTRINELGLTAITS